MIDASCSTPLYQQLASLLEQAILNGEFAVGDKLPSENELCRAHGISRITVRQALSQLEVKGLVTTQHRRGTFVNPAKINQSLIKIVNFGKVLQEKDLSGKTAVAAFEALATNPRMDSLLQAAMYGPVSRMDLVGSAGGEPIVYYQSHIRQQIAQRMLPKAVTLEGEGMAFSTFDLYEYVEVAIGEIDQTISAVNADEHMAGLLQVPEGEALIVLDTLVYDTAHRPVEHKLGHYRADKYRFHLTREV